MNGIVISRGGVPPGPPIPLNEVKKLVAEGNLQQNQMAWCEGLLDWEPLHSVVDYVERNTPPAVRAIVDGTLPEESSGAGDEPSDPQVVADDPHLKTSRLLSRFFRPRPDQIPHTSNSEEMGDRLWEFVKNSAREFCNSLSEKLAEYRITLDDGIRFNMSQEAVILHLWLISKVLGPKRKAIRVLHRKFVLSQARLAESYEHHHERVEYTRSMKQTFLERFTTYHHSWNDHSARAQTDAASLLLKYILGVNTTCRKPVENLLVSHINSYLYKMPRVIASFKPEIESLDKLTQKYW